MFMKDETNECCSLYCQCGCTNGVVLRAEDDMGLGCDMTLVSDNYYLMQMTAWTRFKEKCKRIWCILRNKEYCYFSIYMAKDDLEEFKKFVVRM